MIITDKIQNIQKLFRGCLSVIEKDGTYSFLRLTGKQKNYFAEQSDSFGIRARCTAGIRLDFYTDAAEISFRYKCSDFSRPIIRFDIYENGTFTDNVVSDKETPEGELRYLCETEGRKRITVWLPNLTSCVLSNLALGNAEPVEIPEKRLLFLGDSITQGMVVEHPSLTIPALMGEYLNADFLNQGVGGCMFDANAIDETDSYSPDVIFAAFGSNDAFQEKAHPRMDRAIPAFFEKLRSIYPDKTVVVISAPWHDAAFQRVGDPKDFLRARALAKSAAEKYGCLFVDGTALIPHKAEFFAPDRLHPCTLGAQYYAYKLYKTIRDQL